MCSTKSTLKHLIIFLWLWTEYNTYKKSDIIYCYVYNSHSLKDDWNNCWTRGLERWSRFAWSLLRPVVFFGPPCGKYLYDEEPKLHCAICTSTVSLKGVFAGKVLVFNRDNSFFCDKHLSLSMLHIFEELISFPNGNEDFSKQSDVGVDPTGYTPEDTVDIASMHWTGQHFFLALRTIFVFLLSSANFGLEKDNGRTKIKSCLFKLSFLA